MLKTKLNDQICITEKNDPDDDSFGLFHLQTFLHFHTTLFTNSQSLKSTIDKESTRTLLKQFTCRI